MAKTAKDYPITTKFGCLKNYPLNHNMCSRPGYGLHRGVDRAMKSNTPLRVTSKLHPKPNGKLLGKTGNTGMSSGPHLHIGKFINGQPVNPSTYGFNFPKGATVYSTGESSVNGKYIKLRDNATGYIWFYCHLSRIDVKMGQTI